MVVAPGSARQKRATGPAINGIEPFDPSDPATPPGSARLAQTADISSHARRSELPTCAHALAATPTIDRGLRSCDAAPLDPQCAAPDSERCRGTACDCERSSSSLERGRTTQIAHSTPWRRATNAAHLHASRECRCTTIHHPVVLQGNTPQHIGLANFHPITPRRVGQWRRRAPRCCPNIASRCAPSSARHGFAIGCLRPTRQTAHRLASHPPSSINRAAMPSHVL